MFKRNRAKLCHIVWCSVARRSVFSLGGWRKGRVVCGRNIEHEHGFCQTHKAENTDPRTNYAEKYATARGHLTLVATTHFSSFTSEWLAGSHSRFFCAARRLVLSTHTFTWRSRENASLLHSIHANAFIPWRAFRPQTKYLAPPPKILCRHAPGPLRPRSPRGRPPPSWGFQ